MWVGGGGRGGALARSGLFLGCCECIRQAPLPLQSSPGARRGGGGGEVNVHCAEIEKSLGPEPACVRLVYLGEII